MGDSGGDPIAAKPLRNLAKDSLAGLPFTAEAYQAWVARSQPPSSGFRLDRLVEALPGWIESAGAARQRSRVTEPKGVLVVGYLSWWLEYAAALASWFAGLGHRVSLGYLPYRNWRDPIGRWELRRQSAYLREVLSRAEPQMQLHDLTQVRHAGIPSGLTESLANLSRSDVQYTVQRETLALTDDSDEAALYALRLERNRGAAAGLAGLIRDHAYEVVVVPNGSILEFGAVFLTAQHLGVRVSSFEFGEQRERMWIAQDDQVMLQHTDDMWRSAREVELTDNQQADLGALLGARSGGRTWANFARRWQKAERSGSDRTREELGLRADRPVALLCTNVVGDSLALNRQLFTEGMEDWLRETARFFGERPEAQLVVRVHPGELIGVGLPSVDIVRRALPELPEHVRVVPPESKINTYDLMDLADLGLVYTTTVGLEMAILGLPVVVAGRTHYAQKGFTLDPSTQQQYFALLDSALRNPSASAPDARQIALARRYAYRFFFDYPFHVPWHLIGFWDDIGKRPLKEILGGEVSDRYQAAADALLGTPIDWGNRRELELASAS